MIIYDHMGHMVSTTSSVELHSFAKSIGLKREWYQVKQNFVRDPNGYHYEHHSHYDLTTYRMMNKARKAGATMVDPKQIILKAWWSRYA